MYEHPQYFTPDGFKRLPKKPHKDARKKAVSRALTRKKKNSPASSGQKKIVISPKQAKLIAKALKSVMKD